eukprot:jgi/Mesen1/4909/ME000245S03964
MKQIFALKPPARSTCGRVKAIFEMEAARLLHRQGSVFDQVPDDKTILVHACNCKGNWGAGIAKEFANRYSASYEEYKKVCSSKEGVDLIGTYLNASGIGCLFTSIGYGRKRDPPDEILEFTKLAVEAMLAELAPTVTIHSPRINAGLFCVPWEETEEVIKACISVTGHTWIVWTPGGGFEEAGVEEEEEEPAGADVDGLGPLDTDLSTPKKTTKLRSQRISWGGTSALEYEQEEEGDGEHKD